MSFATGALLGNTFFHLLPTATRFNLSAITIGMYAIFGIILFFIIEKIVHLQRTHRVITNNTIASFGITNLIGDALHNFIDGIAIGTSFLFSIPLGISTTFAIALHEIPQEFSDFGILLHAGFSWKKALWYNFLSSLSALAGVITLWYMHQVLSTTVVYLIPFTAGGFIYIACSNLIPELQKEITPFRSVLQTLCLILGILIMFLLVFLNHSD